MLNTDKLKGFHYKYKQKFSKAFFGLQKEVAALFIHGIIPIQTRWPPAGRGSCACMAHTLQHRNSLFYFGFFYQITLQLQYFLNEVELPSHIKNPIINLSCKTEIELISCCWVPLIFSTPWGHWRRLSFSLINVVCSFSCAGELMVLILPVSKEPTISVSVVTKCNLYTEAAPAPPSTAHRPLLSQNI